MNDTFREFMRAAKWVAYPLAAKTRATLPVGRLRHPITFLLGCGRSGTTILGNVLSKHRGIRYLNEPLHYWYAIDSRTDQIDFFGSKGQCFLDAADVTPSARARFDRLFGQTEWCSRGRSILEKLPANTLRIRWLHALAPNARFIHLIRDGRFVCRSIDELSTSNQYRVSGKRDLHQWWGRNFYKWETFTRECRDRGLCTESFTALEKPEPWAYPAMAALEWLVKVKEMRIATEQLGLGPDQIIEVRYEDLVANPEEPLRQIEQLMGLPHDPNMVEHARAELKPRKWGTPDIALPPPLYHEFSAKQEKLGYSNAGVRLLAPSVSTAS